MELFKISTNLISWEVLQYIGLLYLLPLSQVTGLTVEEVEKL